MKNFTQEDVDGMLTESKLRSLQENYSYYLWTILAVGTVAATIQLMRK